MVIRCRPEKSSRIGPAIQLTALLNTNEAKLFHSNPHLKTELSAAINFSRMDHFNIRVYGILINEKQQLLVSDEWIRGQRYTKFPGGGMEFGEGTRDCLRREFLEEMNLRVDVGAHLYTTDYFQRSAFHPQHQIVSIYYFVQPLEPIQVRLSEIPFDFDARQLEQYHQGGETEAFRFIPLDGLKEEQLSLPIDRIVVRMLLDNARLQP